MPGFTKMSGCIITVGCDKVDTFVNEQRNIVRCKRLISENVIAVLYSKHNTHYSLLLCTLSISIRRLDAETNSQLGGLTFHNPR